jgi:hypothetical protein
MLAYYLQVNWVHIAAVLCSGTLFALRGLLVQLSPQAGLASAGVAPGLVGASGTGAARWAMAAPLR